MKRLILVSILVCSIKCFGASGGLSGSPLSGGGSGSGTGAATNVAYQVMTNFVLNTVYTNTSGGPMLISSMVRVHTAAVNGDSSIDLMADQSGGTTFIPFGGLRLGTIVAVTLAMDYTNSVSVVVSNSATYYWTNSSAGAGNIGALIAGTTSYTALGAVTNFVSAGGSPPVAGTNISVAGSTVNLVSQPAFDAVNVSNTFNEPTTVFVRSNGVNVTAMRGNHQFPFLTMQAAKVVMQTGDTMDIGPGTYTGVCDKTNCFYNLLENCVLDALPCVSATNGYIFIRGKGSLIGDLMLSNATAIVECNLCAFNFGSGAPVTIGNTTNYLILQHFRTYATDFGSSSNLIIVGRGDLGTGAIGNWSKSNNHGDFIVRRWGLPSVTTFDFTGSTPTKHSLNIMCDVAYFDDSGGSLPINFSNGTITLTANQIFFANSASGPAMSLTGTIGALPFSVANILGSPFVNTNVPIPVEPRNPDFDILGL